MNIFPLCGALIGISLIAGCANNSANMRVGTEQSIVSLRDQREASLTVKEYPTAPEGAEKVAVVDASRCHRNSLQTPPTDADVVADLKSVAYAKGADGITDVRVSKESGLLLNCWSILTGTAQAIRVAR